MVVHRLILWPRTGLMAMPDCEPNAAREARESRPPVWPKGGRPRAKNEMQQPLRRKVARKVEASWAVPWQVLADLVEPAFGSVPTLPSGSRRKPGRPMAIKPRARPAADLVHKPRQKTDKGGGRKTGGFPLARAGRRRQFADSDHLSGRAKPWKR